MAPPEGPGVQRWRGVGSIGIKSDLAERFERVVVELTGVGGIRIAIGGAPRAPQ
jgi:hypothetical protein